MKDKMIGILTVWTIAIVALSAGIIYGLPVAAVASILILGTK